MSRCMKIWQACLYLFLAMSPQADAQQKLRIAATTASIASVAGEIAGSTAEIYAIAPSNRNLHFISPTPKDVLKVKKADIFAHGGLDLEVWRGPLLDASGRKEFISGERAIDVSHAIELMNPPEEISRAHGDIHVHGNPHYWTDPVNAQQIADTLAGRLAEIYPDSAGFFQANAGRFKARIDERLAEWQKRLAPFKGSKVIAYHDSWPYFLRRFGLEAAGFLEPQPGIAPTPRHLDELKQIMKNGSVRVILLEPYQEKKTAEKLVRETGAVLALLQQHDGPEAGGYEAMIEKNVTALQQAFLKADAFVREV